MLMVCRLETGNGGKAMQSAYSSIRSRYVNFPEYWYRGALSAARSFGNMPADYAERCINLSPDAPMLRNAGKLSPAFSACWWKK
jgi:hypothetical protein